MLGLAGVSHHPLFGDVDDLLALDMFLRGERQVLVERAAVEFEGGLGELDKPLERQGEQLLVELALEVVPASVLAEHGAVEPLGLPCQVEQAVDDPLRLLLALAIFELDRLLVANQLERLEQLHDEAHTPQHRLASVVQPRRARDHHKVLALVVA